MHYIREPLARLWISAFLDPRQLTHNSIRTITRGAIGSGFLSNTATRMVIPQRIFGTAAGQSFNAIFCSGMWEGELITVQHMLAIDHYNNSAWNQR